MVSEEVVGGHSESPSGIVARYFRLEGAYGEVPGEVEVDSRPCLELLTQLQLRRILRRKERANGGFFSNQLHYLSSKSCLVHCLRSLWRETENTVGLGSPHAFPGRNSDLEFSSCSGESLGDRVNRQSAAVHGRC